MTSVIAENQQFKVFSRGDCGASPAHRVTVHVVRIDDCSKNIKGHLKTCSVAESALNSEARLLLSDC